MMFQTRIMPNGTTTTFCTTGYVLGPTSIYGYLWEPWPPKRTSHTSQNGVKSKPALSVVKNVKE